MVNITRLAKWIQSQLDVDTATARQYANAIGDTPEIDADGLTLIEDMRTGEVIARVKLAWKV